MASKRKREDIDETEEQRNSETETTAELEKRPCRSDDPELNYEHNAPDNESDSPYTSADKTETTAELEPRPSCSHEEPEFYDISAPCNLPELESIYSSVDKKDGMQVLASMIKANGVTEFIQYVWSNPKLLYNRDGTLPSVVYNGTHYNLIQFAVILDRPLFCQLILDIFQNPRFIKEIFPFFVDEDEIRAEMPGLIKLYLNSKSPSGETALHYASEYGHLNCCRILLSHPFCNISSLNEGGFQANQVICLKAEGRTALQFNMIQELFTDGMIYVPVYRSRRDSCNMVGKPTPCREFNSLIFNDNVSSQVNERHLYYLNAFAGPMSSKKAEIFYTALQSPSNSHLFTLDGKNDLERIKREDLIRGVERIGRSLAKDMGIQWKEFIPVLNVFTNLADDEGLKIFEDFLIDKKRNGYPLPVLPPLFVEDMNMGLLPLHDIQKPHINPLCHKANTLYCFSQKFITVESAYDDQKQLIFRPVFPHDVKFPEDKFSSAPLGISNLICLNGYSMTNLDRQVHAAVKIYFDASVYREVSHWLEKIGDELELEYERRGVDGSVIPVPTPHGWEELDD